MTRTGCAVDITDICGTVYRLIAAEERGLAECCGERRVTAGI
ncbi:MAG: hypothetical protein ACK58J_06190 [Planctomyces sp.]